MRYTVGQGIVFTVGKLRDLFEFNQFIHAYRTEIAAAIVGTFETPGITSQMVSKINGI